MQPAKATLFFTLITFFTLHLGAFGTPRPRLWTVRNEQGVRLFSVWADTVYGIVPDVYCILQNEEAILFKGDPFHPVARFEGRIPIPFSDQVFFLHSEHSFQLVPARSPDQPGPYRLRHAETWGKHLVAWTDSRVLLNPGTPDEQMGDTLIKSRKYWFVPIRDRGVIRFDSASSPAFFSLRTQPRQVSPAGNYFLLDSMWQSWEGLSRMYLSRADEEWWGDSLLIQRIKPQAGICRPGKGCLAEFDSLGIPGFSWIFFRKGKSAGVLHASGKLFPFPATRIWMPVSDTAFAFVKGKQWILRGLAGWKVPVNPSVTEIGSENEGLFKVKAGKRFGFIDKTGQIRFSCRYDSVLGFSEGLNAARLGQNWGFWDRNERIRIQPHYDQVTSFRNGLAAVQRGGKWGLIAPAGTFVQDCRFDSLVLQASGRWKTRLKSWAGFLEKDGSHLLPNRYSDIIEAGKYLFLVKRDEKWGAFSVDGKEVIPFQNSRLIHEPKMKVVIYPENLL